MKTFYDKRSSNFVTFSSKSHVILISCCLFLVLILTTLKLYADAADFSFLFSINPSLKKSETINATYCCQGQTLSGFHASEITVDSYSTKSDSLEFSLSISNPSSAPIQLAGQNFQLLLQYPQRPSYRLLVNPNSFQKTIPHHSKESLSLTFPVKDPALLSQANYCLTLYDDSGERIMQFFPNIDTSSVSLR